MGQDASSLANLEKKLGYYFRNKALLNEAMSHNSLRVNDCSLRDYQRLEFFGDAVLSFVITNHLFLKFPTWNEGKLSQRRDELICRTMQSKIAEELELAKFVKMSPSVQQFKRHDKFLEALIGAVFQDAETYNGTGYAAVKGVISKLWGRELDIGQGRVSTSSSSSSSIYGYDD